MKKKTHLRKRMTLVAVLCLTLCLLIGCLTVWAEQESTVINQSYTEDSTESLPIEPGGKKLAAKFEVSRGVMTELNFVRLPTWSTSINSFQFSLYQWSNSYEETLRGDAIFTQKVENHPDTEDCVIRFDTPIPSGRYLWVISDSKATTSEGAVGIGVSPWLVDKSNLKGLICYDDGVAMNGRYFKFSYTTKYKESDPVLGPEETPDPGDRVHYETQPLYKGTDKHMPLASSYKELGGKFAVKKGQLLSLTFVNLPTWQVDMNSFQFDLYEWKYDYATTVEGEALFSQYVENHPNEANRTFEFPEALPAGRYLWVMSEIDAINPDGSTGLGVSPWRTKEGPDGMEGEVICFYEGEPLSEYLEKNIMEDEENDGGPFCYYMVSVKVSYKESDTEIEAEATKPPATPTPTPEHSSVPSVSPSATLVVEHPPASKLPWLIAGIAAVVVVAAGVIVFLSLKKKKNKS